jgi:SLBB domain
MNLSWHIAKKDIRRFWAPLLLISVVTLLRLMVGVCLLRSDGSDPGLFGRMAAYANILWGIGLFLTYILVGSVVHEDSLAKEAFWQTRPISGLSLLSGKLLGFFLMFVLLPVLLLIPWWVFCGFGWLEIWNASGEILAIQIGVVLLALPWGVVTKDDGRFLLWTVVVAVAFATTFIMLAGQSKVTQRELMPWFGMARVLAVVLVAAVGSLVVTIHQFATRRTVTSVILIVVSLALMLAASRSARWDGSRLWLPKFRPPSGLAKNVAISCENSWEWSTTDGFGAGEGSLFATGMQPPYILSRFYSQAHLQWADGKVTDDQAGFENWGTLGTSTLAGPLLRLNPEPPDQGWVRYRERRFLFPRTVWGPQNGSKIPLPFTMVLSPETMIKLFGEKPRFDGTFWFRVLEPQLIGEKALQVGTEFTVGAKDSRLAAVENDKIKQDIWLSFVDRSPEFLWTDFLEAIKLAPWRIQPIHLVVDRTRTHITYDFGQSTIHALVAGVSITLRKSAFLSRKHWNESEHIWENESGGFDGATVAEIDYREVERFSLPLTIDKFLALRGGKGTEPSFRKGTYSVSGEVSKAGDFDLGPGVTLINALRTAGGISDRADLKRVELRRTAPDGTTSTTTVDVDYWLENEGLNTNSLPLLQPGDVIVVPAIGSGHAP